jgi:excisionase family DNA binding protein
MSNPQTRPLAYRVDDFCKQIGISRTSFYELLKKGKIRTVLIAGRRLIPASEVERLLSADAPSAHIEDSAFSCASIEQAPRKEQL